MSECGACAVRMCHACVQVTAGSAFQSLEWEGKLRDGDSERIVEFCIIPLSRNRKSNFLCVAQIPESVHFCGCTINCCVILPVVYFLMKVE